MDTENLKKTIQALLTKNKGLLAMDESTNTCNKRFAKLNIPQTIDERRAYRELLVTTPQLNNYISGAILCDETIRQSTKSGQKMVDVLKQVGIVPGIKVDGGTVDLSGFAGEKVTEGLDGLRIRLVEYVQLGAQFAKWRAVITIGESIPTQECIRTNMHILARYAALCQEVGLVPIVEPEVLMDGAHDLQHCYETTKKVLLTLFNELRMQRVDISGVILKSNMILPGTKSTVQNSIEEIADATINCFLDVVPASLPGIVFLSGGQSAELATARLNAMHVRFESILPWALSFSFSRALQQPVLKLWAGENNNVESAQQAFYHRAQLNSKAVQGLYDSKMEK